MMMGGMDWQERGAVTRVRNQGQCGSCWAIAATEAIEGNLFINSGELVDLSAEYLVDCDRGSAGCKGGSMDQAFSFVSKNGICTNEDDPYTGGASECRCVPRVGIDDYVRVTPTVSALTRAVSRTPVAVAIEADARVFQFYKSGIIDSQSCGQNMDHGVLLVGFGYDQNQSYWRVKNSWGSDWGEDGYVRISRDEGDVCGILQQASYPVGAKNTINAEKTRQSVAQYTGAFAAVMRWVQDALFSR
mgnify:CR=1 FL=1